jgi:outer membrane immunogenic protein
MRRIAFAAAAVSMMVGGASAADLPVKAPVAAPIFSWNGWYLGADVGWAQAEDRLSHSPFYASPGAAFDIDAAAQAAAASPNLKSSDGVAGGLFTGINFQNGMFVWGGEADISAMGIGKSQSLIVPFPSTLPGGPLGPPTLTFNANHSFNVEWQATFRGRLGVAVNDWLFYGTGGLAVASINEAQNVGNLITGASTSRFANNDTRLGWVAGGGIEHAIASNWIVRLEYLHADYGSSNHSTSLVAPTAALQNVWCQPGQAAAPGPAIVSAGCSLSTHVTTDFVRVGLSYKFGGPVGVVAKY